MQQNSISLDEVKSHFDHWRAIRTKQRERIPQYLWDEVKTLLSRYSLADITTTLRINTGQIKNNLKINRKINFVEAHVDNSNSVFHPSLLLMDKEHTCSIELHRSNGVVLKVSALPFAAISKIITQFME